MIDIVAVGKSPPAWVVDAYHTYSQRLQSTWPTRLIEIAADRSAQKKTRVAKEGEKLIAHMSARTMCVALDIRAKQLDSHGFERFMMMMREQSQHQSFVIGGSDGLSDDVLDKSNHMVSLSKLTFTHYIARVVLIEQIYRSWCIMSHHPYHK